MDMEIDANIVIEIMKNTVGNLTTENAMLKAKIVALENQAQNVKFEEYKEKRNGG